MQKRTNKNRNIHSSFFILHSSRSRAFTLVELMVVITIIALLSGIILVNLGSARSRARDAKRVSDIAQIQLALEQYFDRCGQYPSAITNPTSAITSASCPTGINLGTFISKIPTPPAGGPTVQTKYDYAFNSPSDNDFVLHIAFENYSDALKDSLSGIPSAPIWVNNGGDPFSCNGTVPYDYCIGTK